MQKQNFMEKYFGVNWRTSFFGYITVIAAAIALNPTSIEFLPDDLEKNIRGVAGLISIISGMIAARNTKDKDVTGGTVPSTHEAEKRIDEDAPKNP